MLDEELERSILADKWFYRFPFPSGRSTEAFVGDDKLGFHQDRLDMVMRTVDNGFGSDWSGLTCLDLGAHQGFFSFNMARKECKSVLGIEARPEMRMMISKTSSSTLIIQLLKSALVVMRYRVVVDDRLLAARLRTCYGAQEIVSEVFAQSEDRMLHFIYDPAILDVRFELADLGGEPSREESRIRIAILQCIPFNTDKVDPVLNQSKGSD